MKIELKAIKVFPSLSEETTCFSASLWINGKRVGTADNRGEGGPTNYHPVDYKNPAHKEAIRAAEAWAKAQPDIVHDMSRYGVESFTTPCTLEHIIDNLVGDYLEAEAEKAEQKKRDAQCRKWTMFTTPDSEPNTFSYYRRPYSQKMIDFIMERHPDATIIHPSWAQQ